MLTLQLVGYLVYSFQVKYPQLILHLKKYFHIRYISTVCSDAIIQNKFPSKGSLSS